MVLYVYERYRYANVLRRLAEVLEVARAVYGGVEVRGVRPVWVPIEYAKSEVDVITVGFMSRYGTSDVDAYFGVGVSAGVGVAAPYVYRHLQPVPYGLLLSVDAMNYYKYDG